jgi:hypothetical protein
MSFSVSPLYAIHRYRDDIYKVIAFKGERDPEKVFFRDPEKEEHNDVKLDSNFSRARSMVLQYALCNPWQYFFTGTLDPEKWDRSKLDPFIAALSQKIRDWRKSYGFKLDVLLVPEQHKDGSWHVHGLVNNLPDWEVGHFMQLDLRSVGLGWLFPSRLCDCDFLNWYDFCETFGYCSLAPVRDPVATAFYITKYVSKDLSRRSGDLGKHLYFHSRPLQKAEKASDVYLYNSGLEKLCTADFDFCKVGMVEDQSWSFPYLWDGSEPADAVDPLFPAPAPLVPDVAFNPFQVDPDYEQLEISR